MLSASQRSPATSTRSLSSISADFRLVHEWQLDRLAVALAHNSSTALIAAGLLGSFVLGVAGGSLAGHFAKSHRRVAILLLVAALLGSAHESAALGAMALAIGAENAVFEHDGGTRSG